MRIISCVQSGPEKILKISNGPLANVIQLQSYVMLSVAEIKPDCWYQREALNVSIVFLNLWRSVCF